MSPLHAPPYRPGGHTRNTLALAHHRFYCVFGKADECTEIDDTDYDFADFAMQLFAETETGCEEASEVVSSQPTNDDGAATPPADTGVRSAQAAESATGVGAPEAAPSSHTFVHSEAFVVPLEDPADKGGEQDEPLLGLAQVADESPAGGRGPLTDSPEGES